jgi:hypothetical protein
MSTYIPKLHDYVIWTRSTGTINQGWVYFVDEDYITIETAVRDKPNCQYTINEKHKKIHTLVLCHKVYWNQLKYLKERSDHYDEVH